MVLYMIGLGLGDEDDITVKGLKAIEKSDVVILESYTSVLGINKEKLEQTYQKPVIVADRNIVESEAEDIILLKDKTVAFLVVGDPLCATTHTDLWLRARQLGIQVEIIHNASIMGAAASSGLSLYNFGQTVSIPFFEENWKPISFVPKIQYNLRGGMHTLCLLDIKVKEPDFNAMMRGCTKYLPPRFMSVSIAAQQLIESHELDKNHGNASNSNDDNDDDNTDRDANNGNDDTAESDNNNNDGNNNQKESKSPLSEFPQEEEKSYMDSLCIGLARMGQPTQQIMAGTIHEMAQVDMGDPLHALILCGDLHELEMEVVKQFLIEGSTYKFSSTH